MATLRRVVIPFVLAVCLISSVGTIFTASAQIPQHIWSHRFGDASFQSGWSVAVDGSGSVIVTGSFVGTVDFGGGPLASAGSEDIFVAKFDAGGNHVWSQRFGDASSQRGQCVAVDGLRNVILTGGFQGTVDFGGGPLTSAGENDIFVAKFDAGGNHVWSQRFGDASSQTGRSVAVDGSRNVIIKGYFWGTVEFGGGPLTSAGSHDIFVAKFDAGGNHVWSQRFGEASNQRGVSVAVGGSGNVIVTGHFWGTVDFGAGPLTSAGNYDIFVAKFDAGGNHLWSQRFGDASSQRGQSVAVNGSGNVILTGYSQGTVAFGGGPLTSAGSDDIFVAKFDAGGNHVWSQRFGDASLQRGESVAVGGSGNVLVTGHFRGIVDFGGGPLTSAGGDDIFIAKFGADPSPTLLQSFSTTVNEIGIEINWHLAEAGKDMEFYVLRAQATNTQFQELYNANIVQKNLSFTFVDEDYKPGHTYSYRVDVTDEEGRRTLFETDAITTPARSLTLDQNYPNPFNPTTTISFVLPERAHVDLSVFTVDGKLIKTLVNQPLTDGFNEATWNGTDAKGVSVSSGVYLYRLQAGKKSITKKMVLLK
jgi:hypothetical protein